MKSHVMDLAHCSIFYICRQNLSGLLIELGVIFAKKHVGNSSPDFKFAKVLVTSSGDK